MERCFLVLIRAIQPFGMALKDCFDLFQVAAPDGVVDLFRCRGENKKQQSGAYKQTYRYGPD
jgi:hypothetical protein